MQLHTTTLTAGQSLTITTALNVLQLSVMIPPSSSGTIAGSLKIGAVASSAIPLTDNQGFSMSSALPNSPIDGVIISCVSGTVNISLSVQ